MLPSSAPPLTWLPLRHVMGLNSIFFVILSSLGAGWVWLNAQDG